MLTSEQTDALITLLNEQGYATDEDGCGINQHTVKWIVNNLAKLRENGYTSGGVQFVAGHSSTHGTVFVVFNCRILKLPKAKKVLKMKYNVSF